MAIGQKTFIEQFKKYADGQAVTWPCGRHINFAIGTNAFGLYSIRQIQ